MRRTTAAVLAAAALAVPMGAPAVAQTVAQTEPGATFEFVAEEGSFPVGGREGAWATPDQEVRVREQAVEGGALVVDGDSDGWDHIRVQLAGPGGAPLEVGTHTAVTRRPTATTAGLLVVSRGLGCHDVFGGFTVHRIERDPVTGRLTDVDVEVEQRCGAPDAPAFRAHVTLNG